MMMMLSVICFQTRSSLETVSTYQNKRLWDGKCVQTSREDEDEEDEGREFCFGVLSASSGCVAETSLSDCQCRLARTSSQPAGVDGNRNSAFTAIDSRHH
jgi:hypothetical protein